MFFSFSSFLTSLFQIRKFNSKKNQFENSEKVLQTQGSETVDTDSFKATLINTFYDTNIAMTT